LQVPEPFSLQVQLEQLDSMLHEPLLLQSTTQPPPGHFRFAEPGPVEVTVQSPSVQVRLQEPDPLQTNLQPLPAHV